MIARSAASLLVIAALFAPRGAFASLTQHDYGVLADTYVQRGAPTNNYGLGDGFLVKRDAATTSGSTDRLGLIRFNTTGIPTPILGGTLALAINAYPGDGVSTLFVYHLYGLPDAHPAEAFIETNLTFATFTNGSAIHPGSFNPTGTVFLGTFQSTAQTTPLTLYCTNDAVRGFLSSNANGHATFVIVRESPNAGLPTTFASREESDLHLRPTLLAYTAGTAINPAAVTASSTLDGTPDTSATNAVDDSFITRWTAAADTGSSTNRAWIRLDLGATNAINRFNFTPFQFGRSFHLEGSTNGTTWTTILTNIVTSAGTNVNRLKIETTRFFQPRIVRYVRLTSLTTINGRSLSLWDAQVALDTNATLALARITNIANSVAALATNTPAEGVKRAVFDIALERAQAGLDVGEITYCTNLLNDVEARLGTNAANMAAPAAGVTNLSVLRPLLATTTNTNPYLRRMVTGANLSMAAAELPVPKSTPNSNYLADFSFARTYAWQLDSYFWLFAHTNSPLASNAETLRRMLRRFHAFTDAMDVHAQSYAPGQLSSFYDDFAMGPASVPLREFALRYPNLLLPTDRAQWSSGIAKASDVIWATHQNRVASWVNTDVAISVQLYNFGTLRTNQAFLDKAQYFIDAVISSNRLFADGAVGYIGTQNEAGGYQDTVAEYVSRYYEINSNATALTILQGMEWYGPVNGRIVDWWTSPSWKDAWNNITSSMPAGEAPAGTNPYVRAELDLITNAATTANWYGSPRVDVAWYQPGTVARARPDYTIFDRNIQGPRAWNGLFNYSATLRKINDSESGLATVMGCQVADPDPNFRVNACLMGIAARLRVSPLSSRNADDTLNESRHSWLTTRFSGESTVTRDVSSLGVSHLIHSFGSSVKGVETNWNVRQIWIGLPDRIIGRIDIAPNENLNAYEVQGVIRLGFGGTAYSSNKTLVANGSNAWNYGNLAIRVHAHDFASVDPEVYTFRVTNAPVTEITLRDQVGGGANSNLLSYPAGQRRSWITEVRNRASSNEVTVTDVSTNGLVGIDVNHPTAERRYRLVYNPSSNSIVYPPALTWTGTVRLVTNGAQYRPSWVPAPSGPIPVTYLTNLAPTLLIPAGAHYLFIQDGSTVKASGTNALDDATSWVDGTLADASLALWNSTSTNAATNSLGLGFNLSGIRFTGSGGPVTLGVPGDGTLALGPLGIDLSQSPRMLTLATTVRLDIAQTWITSTGSTAYAAQIHATAPIVGPGSLTIEANGTPPRPVRFDSSNTFTGGLVVGPGAAVLLGGSSVSNASGLVASPLGLGDVTFQAGSSLLASNNQTVAVPNGKSLRIEGDIAIGQTTTGSTTVGAGRIELGAAIDLDGATRTVTLGRVQGTAAAAASGGNVGFRLGTFYSSGSSVSNGVLRVARDPDSASTNYVGLGFGLSTAWYGGSGLRLATGVVSSFQSGFAFNTSNALPRVTLESGSILNLSDGGGTARNVQIHSLSGTGLVANLCTAPTGAVATLTLVGDATVTTNAFAGLIRDRDPALAPLAVNGTVALVKAGTNSTQILTGSNSYSGPTTINSGTLVIHGDQSAATGGVLVTSFATLGGTGVIGGAVTVATGGTHDPGPSPGTQTLATGIVYETGAAFRWELTANATNAPGTTFDRVRLLSGNVTLQTGVTSLVIVNGPGSSVSWSHPFWGSTQRWTVFTAPAAPAPGSAAVFDSVSVTADASGVDLAALGGSFAWAVEGTNVVLVYSPPDPFTVWLYQNFGTNSPTGIAATSADPDGDTVPNIEEYHAGTNPLSEMDRMQIRNMRSTPGGFQFDVDARADRRYDVFRSTTLKAGSWVAVGTTIHPASTNRLLIFNDPAPPGPETFYRVRVERP
jgi:autotransporter-associated beta strand protein